MNIQDIIEAVEIAKAKTNNKRWQAAIDKAVAGVQGGWIVTELANGIMSQSRLFSSHLELSRVECATHASLFRSCRQSYANRGKKLTCKTIYTLAAVKTA